MAAFENEAKAKFLYVGRRKKNKDKTTKRKSVILEEIEVKNEPVISNQSPPKQENLNENTQEKIEIKEMLPKDYVLIDSINFSNDKNNLKILFIKKLNRSYRIQVYLNDAIEIRPATYNGGNTASSYWNLLKGTLKK